MAVSDAYLAYVLEQLGGVKAITHCRMFGGIGLYAREHFFGVIDNNTLFFKVDAASVGEYTRAKMKPFQPDPKGKPMMGYYQVPPSVLEDDQQLASWAKRAAEIQGTNKKKSNKKKAST
jgi:TfoX/Sxy family transcriptional regulator of competence genes